jgi:hypothetical protein
VRFGFGFLEVQIRLLVGMFGALRVIEQTLDSQQLHAGKFMSFEASSENELPLAFHHRRRLVFYREHLFAEASSKSFFLFFLLASSIKLPSPQFLVRWP